MWAVHNYVLEEEPREYVNSVNIEDNLDDEYNLQEQQHYDEVEAEAVLENAYAEDNSTSLHTLDAVPVAPDVVLDEPVEEPQRKTYASIVWICSVVAAYLCLSYYPAFKSTTCLMLFRACSCSLYV